ncbi:NmrA family NAD(P)-binding protein [Parafrankia sp. EUN1f]|uniref:NmrA family NAD(P)-binding protein n=1 Tax=Parafrankia sp. EUN1f TaxID=102897 RepID=UPI0001C44DAA|nr:NmrA family NAD(P)-binding protein [Parafrankia sp. EUN1f]EFC84953.1 NmrA family protein [Parafrankia sp. EUN1f]
MTPENKARVLVTGATGMQGGAAVKALLRAGHPVTAFVRDPSSAAAQALAVRGVALATGNLNDAASLEAASAGHDAVFSVQLAGVDPADPGAEQRQARNIATAAKRAGVTQIIHTSVSATGWRSQHPDIEQSDLLKAYWDEKEAAEDAIRQAGFDHWTIFKPAFYMNNFLPAKRDPMFPELPQGKLVTATSPHTVLALICADDFGAAVAAAVAEPDKFHEAEIEFAGDALTHTDIADTLSGREITAVFVSWEQQALRIGAPSADSQIWNDRVGYPARPHHAARYGLTTTTLEQWTAQQDWHIPAARTQAAPPAPPAQRLRVLACVLFAISDSTSIGWIRCSRVPDPPRAVGASAGPDGSPPMPLMSKVDLFAAIRRDSRGDVGASDGRQNTPSAGARSARLWHRRGRRREERATAGVEAGRLQGGHRRHFARGPGRSAQATAPGERIYDRLFAEHDMPAGHAVVFIGATRNSLVVLALALPDQLTVTVVTQTLVEAVGRVVTSVPSHSFDSTHIPPERRRNGLRR